MLAAEVAGVPAQHVAEQHRGLVVEVVAGGDDVVAVLERGRVEEVALRQPARAARARAGWPRRRRGCRSRSRRRGRPRCSVPAARVARTSRAYVARLVGVLADAEPEVEAVGLVAERARGGPTARASPCRPTPRRAPARRAAIMSCVVDRPPDLLLAVVEEVVAAERGVVAAHVDDRRLAGTRRHFTRRSPLRPR